MFYWFIIFCCLNDYAWYRFWLHCVRARTSKTTKTLYNVVRRYKDLGNTTDRPKSPNAFKKGPQTFQLKKMTRGFKLVLNRWGQLQKLISNLFSWEYRSFSILMSLINEDSWESWSWKLYCFNRLKKMFSMEAKLNL